MHIKFFYLELGPPRMKSWNEPTESSLKPCGTPAGSKGSPRTGGRTWRGAEGASAQSTGGGKGLRGPAGEMSSSGLRNCENGDCIVGSRARYKVYTGGADPLRQSHVLAHTRATPAFTKRHDNVQPPLGARARGDAELATGHREGAINRYRSRRQRRRAQSEPVHASGQHFTRATLAPQ